MSDYFSNKPHEALLLKNQICFPLYACSKELIRIYKPYLKKLDLTYTQYITMMVLWEEERINLKDIGERLYLDSGTLTPLLKKLESKGFITRERDPEDERNLMITITQKGRKLQKEAIIIPQKLLEKVPFDTKRAKDMYDYLYVLLEQLRECMPVDV